MKKFLTLCCTLLLAAGIAFADAGTYYSTISTSSPTFVADLHNLIYPHTVISYDNYKSTIIPNYETVTDATGQYVECVYTGYKFYYTGTFAWLPLSREHTFCHSWMPSYPSTSGPEYSDQHHLFPANQNLANGPRSNHPLGIVVTVTSSYLDGKLGTDAQGHTVYEPRDKQKGDAARALMYMMLCYNGEGGLDWTLSHLNTITLPGLSEATEEQALLKQWNTQDPPDSWEVGRNDYIESIQHNRNPFVDHPEYVAMIDFNTLTIVGSVDPPVLATVPSNHVTNFAAGTTTSSTLQLTWTDAVPGVQAPAGYLLMANTSGVFTSPVAGTPVTDDANLADGAAAVHIAYAAADAYSFAGLTQSTKYYFQIVPYNGTGASVNYKTDGTVPAIDATTSAVVIPPGGSVPGAFTAIYEFTGVSIADNQFNAVTAQPAFGTFSTVTRTGVVWTGGNNYFNSNSWPTASARDDAKYVSFSLTLASGYKFQNLPLALAFDISHSNTGPASGEVRYCYNASGVFSSAATFTPPLTSATQTMTVPAPGNATSTSVEVRIYGWGATGSGGTFRLDNLKLSTPPESNLPVELVSFTARPTSGSVELQWSTATETNNYGFDIERSPLGAAGDAGRRWMKIGFVEGFGTSNAAHHYSFIDRSAAGACAYRLKQTDRDGRFEYSREEVLGAAAPTRFELAQNYPNPFNPATTISFACGVSEHATLEVFNVLGQHVTTLFDGFAEGQRPYVVTFDATGYASGVYLYRLTTQSHTEMKRMSLMK